MRTEEIRAEVERLAPWYYAFDLKGVRTDEGPPCDFHGHRHVELPTVAERFLRGRTVLDVGCNEGAYAFAAAELGARSVHGFDVRQINIEKAKFVAGIQGYTNVTFEVATAEGFISAEPPEYDVIFLCGLLYHLVDPAQVIADYSRLARQAIYVTCVLFGGEDGYSHFPEQENIAASANALPSLMPNSTNTLVREFARHGFLPWHVAENRSGLYWGGCTLVLQNVREWPSVRSTEGQGPSAGEVDVYLLPAGVADARGRSAPFDVEVVLYNRSEEQREVELEVRVEGPDGSVVESENRDLVLGPRATEEPGSFSLSEVVPLALDLKSYSGRHMLSAHVRAAGNAPPSVARLEIDAGLRPDYA